MLLVAVAVAVSAIVTPAIGGGIVGGVLGGAAGSVASQGVGLATGLQERFDFKGVALAGLSGGIGSGLGGVVKGTDFFAGAARGALGSAATQGVAIATGLQSRFDWTGVAVGGVVGGVTTALGRGLGLFAKGQNTRSTSYVTRAGLAGSAGAVAGAAARSLVEGTSFGDNVLRVLPDAVGATIGNLAVVRLAGVGGRGGGVRSRADGASSIERALLADARAGASGGVAGLPDGGRIDGSDSAQLGDIVVIADPTMTDMFQAMTPYQFGRYAGQYGEVSYDRGARWALGLPGPMPGQINLAGDWLPGRIGADRAYQQMFGRFGAIAVDDIDRSIAARQAFVANIRDEPLGDGGLVGNLLFDVIITGGVGSAVRGVAGGVALAGRLLSRTGAANSADFVGPSIGKSGFRTSGKFAEAVGARYQGFADDAYVAAQRLEAKGLLRGNAYTRVGDYVDRISARDLKAYLQSEGISEGPNSLVQMNRWLRDPSGSGLYVRPDVRIPAAGRIYDATVGFKAYDSTQIVRFGQYSGGNRITVVRPSPLGSYSIVP